MQRGASSKPCAHTHSQPHLPFLPDHQYPEQAAAAGPNSLTSQRLQKKSKFWRALKLPFSCAHTWFSTTKDWYIGVALLVNIERVLDYFGRGVQIVMLQTLRFPKLSRAGHRKYRSVNSWLCPDTWTMLYSNNLATYFWKMSNNHNDR